MRFTKKILTMATCAVMAASSMVGMSASAASYTRTIDNDSIASGYGNNNTGFSYINNVSTLANGDGRYSSSSSSSNSYEWTYPSLTSGGTTVYADITISAYLAYSSWTDTAAVYGAQYYTFSSKDIGVLNQNKAPNGYSEMSATFKSETGGHLSSYAYIKPSGNTNQTTGADQIKVTISY